ncbi:MAG: hypothetical protein HY040_12155 [Planctomycetes bacterium]|nr:hypothetical protein [Planctomycetota bacterium]
MDPSANDPFEDFLRADFSVPDDSPLRRRLLEETTRILRRRRRLRRVALVGSWAACFAAGVVATLLVRNTSPFEKTPEQGPFAKVPFKEEAKVPEEIAPPTQFVTPLAKEWEAFDSKQNRAALYFEAGNRYLAEENDMQSALRCYRQALALATATELAIQPNDNWLVISLKESRKKELGDVH